MRQISTILVAIIASGLLASCSGHQTGQKLGQMTTRGIEGGVQAAKYEEEHGGPPPEKVEKCLENKEEGTWAYSVGSWINEKLGQEPVC